MSEEPEYCAIALTAIGATAAPGLLATHLPAIVLERIARGGGATNWYVLRMVDDLDALAAQVRPGSSVTFYFDERFALGQLDDRGRASLLAMAKRDGSVVLGAIRDDEVEIEVDFPSSEKEVDEFVSDHPEATLVFGAFPGRDDDGQHAVTVTLPDSDGVVRRHPH